MSHTPEEFSRISHREHEILREIRLSGGNCRISFLAKTLNVSDETVRRNIKTLEAKSLVKKIHGGVLLIADLDQVEQPFRSRMDKNAGVKQLLAATVANMIKDGDSLFLDIGSTTAYIAQALRNHHDLFIVTNSVNISNILSKRNNNRVFQAGGELRSHDGGAFGFDAIQFIRRFNVQYAILSVSAINAENGFMLHDMQEADLSREATKRANTSIIVADSKKFDRLAPIHIDEETKIDMLITDKTPNPDIVNMLEQRNISLTYTS